MRNNSLGGGCANPVQLEALIDEVQAQHRARLDIPVEDLEPRPFQPKRRPNTALISEAAARVTIRKQIERMRVRKLEKA